VDTVESMLWLKKNNLFRKADQYAECLKVVFNECLGAKNDDVLVIGDTGTPEHQVAPLFAGACFLASRSLNLNSKLVFQNLNDPKSVDDVRTHIARIRPGSALVLSMSGRIGSVSDAGKNFKQFCKERRLRYTSTPSLGTLRTSMISTLISTVNVDYRQLSATHNDIKKILDFGEVVHIKTPAGTDLCVPIKGCTAVSSDGYYLKPGLGGNLPAGEVFIAPAKRRVEGKVVVDCSSRSKDTTTIIKEPITLTVRDGEVVDIKGGKEAKALEQSIKYAEENGKSDWGARRIGELGIGLNPNAKLCGSMIIDEKVKGTAHVAIGSNHWFGGTVYAMIHLDQVFKNPHITVDGKHLRI
jgi:hypothetical protein